MPIVKVDRFKENALWARYKAGDTTAFSLIYREYTVYLFQYGFRFCADKEQLKDMVHDLFVELWNSRETVSGQVSIRFYLCRCLKYKLIRANYQYRTASERQYKYLYDHCQDKAESTIEEKIINTETNDSRSTLLNNAIKQLSSRQQEIIMLRFYMGFTNAQIAELMQMKYQSVSNLLYNALNRIKENLQKTTTFTLHFPETPHFTLKLRAK